MLDLHRSGIHSEKRVSVREQNTGAQTSAMDLFCLARPAANIKKDRGQQAVADQRRLPSSKASTTPRAISTECTSDQIRPRSIPLACSVISSETSSADLSSMDT